MSSIMESMGKKRPRPRRSFAPEFKAEIVLADALAAQA
jgi:transposase